jgi:hypothetical protein
MFSPEIKDVLIQVLTSWQVILVTLVLVLYVFLVNYVARLYHRPRSFSILPAKKAKKKKEPPPAEEGTASAEGSDDELGLEE